MRTEQHGVLNRWPAAEIKLKQLLMKREINKKCLKFLDYMHIFHFNKIVCTDLIQCHIKKAQNTQIQLPNPKQKQHLRTFFKTSRANTHSVREGVWECVRTTLSNINYLLGPNTALFSIKIPLIRVSLKHPKHILSWEKEDLLKQKKINRSNSSWSF